MTSVDASPARRALPPAAIDILVRTDTLAICTLSGARVESATPAIDLLLGDGAGVVDADLAAFAVPDDREPLRARLQAFSTSSETRLRVMFLAVHPRLGLRNIELSGVPFSTNGGRRCLAWLTDRTDQARVETQLSFLAYVDVLTGLPNRAHFTDQFSKAVALARKASRSLALLVIDLDGFKQVNDGHGHDRGDALLQIVGQRIADCTRHDDTVARLGGDEFAVILPYLRQPEDAAIVAGRIVRSVGSPIRVGDLDCQVGASIGIAVFPTHADDPDALFSAADAAMYEAKKSGRGRYRTAISHEPTSSLLIELVPWSETHTIGIEALDVQHRGIVDRINRLGEDMKAGLEVDRLLASVKDLVRASEDHFEFEEALMARHGIESAPEHAATHRRLLDDVQSLTTGLDERGLVLTMRFLQEWLFRHVDTTDRVLATTLRAHGER